MQSLTIWESEAICRDLSERPATVIYSGAMPVFTARHWISPALPILHHQELRENYGLLAILMKAADYAEVGGKVYGELRANWSALGALTGFHRTSIHRKLVTLSKAGYIHYDPIAGRHIAGIQIPIRNRKTQDQTFIMRPDFPTRFVTNVRLLRKLYNVEVTGSRSLEFSRATAEDQAPPTPTVQVAPQRNIPEVNRKLEESVSGVLCTATCGSTPETCADERCKVHPKHLTPYRLIMPDRPSPNNDVTQGQTDAPRVGAGAQPQTEAVGAALPPGGSSFVPRATIHTWVENEFDKDDWSCFVSRGGRLEGTPRRGMPAMRLAAVQYYEEIVGIPFCVEDQESLREAFAMTTINRLLSAIKLSAQWPAENPGFFLRKKGFSTILELIKSSPGLQRSARKKRVKKDEIRSGFDEKRALKRRQQRLDAQKEVKA